MDTRSIETTPWAPAQPSAVETARIPLGADSGPTGEMTSTQLHDLHQQLAADQRAAQGAASASPETRRHQPLRTIGTIAVLVALGYGSGWLAFGHQGSNSKQPAVAEAGSTPGTTSGPECGPNNNKIIYYANLAPADSNFFGPAATETTTDGLLSELTERDSCDPATLVAHEVYVGLRAPGTPESRDAAAVAYTHDRNAWSEGLKKLVNKLDRGTMSLQRFTGEYYTMYEVPNSIDGRPEVFQLKKSMTNEAVLRFDFKDAEGNITETLSFKLDCGFQPVRPVPFENVPNLPPKQPKKPKKPQPVVTTPAPHEVKVPQLPNAGATNPASISHQGPGAGGTPGPVGVGVDNSPSPKAPDPNTNSTAPNSNVTTNQDGDGSKKVVGVVASPTAPASPAPGANVAPSASPEGPAPQATNINGLP